MAMITSEKIHLNIMKENMKHSFVPELVESLSPISARGDLHSSLLASQITVLHVTSDHLLHI